MRRIKILTVTHKTPAWIKEGYQDYAKRLPPSCTLELIEIPAEKRTASADIKRITQREGEKILAAIKPNDHVIALDVQGKSFSTEVLAKHLAKWQLEGRNIIFLIGGPEGLSKECLVRAEEKWSLSLLTFPHILVRIILAEQLYRAWSILENHPYHR